MAERINVLPPESGERAAYRLEAGVSVRFAFDLSEAGFAASGNDLVISLPHGGTVILLGYLDLAGQDALPVFELLDGQLVAGGVYLFAFGQEFETAAGDAPGGSGAGAYTDDPGALGNGLDAESGQTTLLGESTQPLGATFAPLPPAEALPGQPETLYPETEPVQIVLNPGFEASGYTGDTWTWLDDVDHWRNTGDPADPVFPQLRDVVLTAARSAESNGGSPMKTWGPDMPQTPVEGERLMELDATSGTVDTLSQAIAVKAGEAVTIAFHFAPRVDEGIHERGMDTNDFQLTLGDQMVAAVTWDAEAGDWLVTPGQGVATADHGTGAFYFSNQGFTPDGSTDWTELAFTLTAHQDHAALTFSEFAARNDGFGTLLDEVTVYRDFHTLVTGGEPDAINHAEYLAGTDGDDAIFGSSHTVVDGMDDVYAFSEVLDGGAGDDALYGGQNFLTVISGGAGNDFMVAGRPLTFGTEESHDTSEPVGETFILPGSGNDYVRLGDGSDSIILNRDALVDGETLTVENFTVDHGDTLNYDQLFLAEGLSLQGASQLDGDLHLLIGDGHDTIQVTLLGVETTDIDAILHTGSEADAINDQIQAIIDSGGHLA